MIKPLIPSNEKERLETLRALKILDSAPEERYDRLTRLAQRLFNVPIVLISLVDKDRQWFKSKQGLEGANETSRDISFCAHAINGNDVMVVNDAFNDNRFSDNPYVTGDPNVRFYAGYPIEAPNHTKMGTLCLIDRKPRSLNGIELELLQNLGRLVENEMLGGNTAFADEISGEADRRFFLRVLRYVMEFSKNMNFSMGMLIIHVPQATSIDGTPMIHDKLVVETAKVLGKSTRMSDIVGKLGEDSFYGFFPKCDKEGLSLIINRINSNLREMKSKLGCSNFKLGLKQFIWTPKSSETIDDLVSIGYELLEESRRETKN